MEVLEVLKLDHLTIEQTKLVNQISQDITPAFNQLSHQLWAHCDQTIDWLVNSLISRNPYSSSLFQMCCFLTLSKKLIELYPDLKEIHTSNVYLYKTLDKYIRETNLSCKIVLTGSKTKFLFQHYLKFLQNLYFALKRCLFYVLSRSRGGRIQGKAGITIIDTFLLKNSFRNGQYEDRYYPGLLDLLTDADKSKIYFVPEISENNQIIKLANAARRTNEKFLLKQDYLKLQDYLFALYLPFRIKKIDFQFFEFYGVNLKYLLEYDFVHRLGSTASINGILNYLFYKRLKEKEVRIESVVEWYENQIVDKGSIKGLRTFYPGTPIIGYQGFIISFDFNFYLQPTVYEQEEMNVVPDKIAVVGKGLINSTKKFNPKLNVVVAPAFRFQHIWKNSSSLGSCSDKSSKGILIVLSISIEDSLNVLRLFHKSYQKLLSSDKEMPIYLKPHPALKLGLLKKDLVETGEWLNEIQILEGSFHRALEKALVVIGNTSSTLVESVAKGIPSVVIGSESGISQNPIPYKVTGKIWKLCYEPEELEKAIRYFLSRSTTEQLMEFQLIGEKNKKGLFRTCNRRRHP